MTPTDDLSGFSMMELFRLETASQTAILIDGLLELERNPNATATLAELMRAAHSLKGAARLVNLDLSVRMAHAMEDCIVEAQRSAISLSPEQINALLRGVDLLSRIAESPEIIGNVLESEVAAEITAIKAELKASPAIFAINANVASSAPVPASPEADLTISSGATASARQAVRVTTENLNLLMGLAGESVVAARWLSGFTKEAMQLKRLYRGLSLSFEALRQARANLPLDDGTQTLLQEMETRETAFSHKLNQSLTDIEAFDRRLTSVSKNLYEAVLDCRMRPFSDGIQGFPRMVRDVARALGKDVQLEISGDSTPVDRDILERLEAPLGHLLRNAIDHGIEPPQERSAAGKPEAGSIKVDARHSAGQLVVAVADDGRGVAIELVRQAAQRKKLVTAEMAATMDEQELLQFLFLPGFTMKTEVTEVSGRGVGLDSVQTMTKDIGGRVHIETMPGEGTRFELKLPLTLSVLRALLVRIAGEAYAFPLTRVVAALRVARENVASVEGRQHFDFRGAQVGLVTAHQVLELSEPESSTDELSVVVIGDAHHEYGVVIDGFLGERELVVRPLHARLGKIPDISAAALMDDQTPVLIIDVDDFSRSVENLASGGRLSNVWHSKIASSVTAKKRILVVDDSLTVRELERKLIDGRGYEVEVAVDGMDAWNAVRTGRYDLVVTDVDMPRLDGIELVTLIRNDPRFQALPVMIVSYKDREEDRRRGLEAGADYYLAKASFHDEKLLTAIEELIGGSDS